MPINSFLKPDPTSSIRGRIWPWLLLVLGLVILLGLAAFMVYQRAAQQNDFVQRRGTQLYLHDQVYRFNGYVNPGFIGCGKQDKLAIDEQLREQYFASLPPGSLTNIYYFDSEHEDQLAALVATAKRYSQRLQVTFADHSAACGETAKTPLWYDTDYQGSYLDRVRQTVTAYKDEPTIAIWEPISQPSGDLQKIGSFLADVVGIIKKNAPHQLVAAGVSTPSGDTATAEWRRIYQTADIDLIVLQDPSDTATVPGSVTRAIQVADGLDRALIVQWGLTAGTGDGCRGFESRQAMAIDKLNAYFDRQNIAGMLYNFVGSEPGDACDTTASLTNLSDSLFYIINGYQIPGVPPVAAKPIDEDVNPTATPQDALPAAPQSLRTVLVSDDTVVFAWKPGEARATSVAGYNVFRNGVISSTSVLTSYTDSDLTPDTNYTYKISAYDQIGNLGEESAVLLVTTSKAGSIKAADATRYSARPIALTAVNKSNPLTIAPDGQPQVSELIQVTNPTLQDTTVAKSELLVNGRSRAVATEPPFALQFDTQTLTNATHELTYRVTLKDGKSATSTRTIAVRNDLQTYERVRNAALEPLAGSSSLLLNGIFIGLAAIILLVPLAIVVAFVKLRGVEEEVEHYDEENKWKAP